MSTVALEHASPGLDSAESSVSPVQAPICRVLVAEDFAGVRQTLRQLLADLPQVEIVGEAEDGAKAAELVRELHPDVLVTDLMMPGLNGFDLMRGLHLTSPGTRTVIVSIHADEPYVVEAFRCGARAYVHKASLSLRLGDALNAVQSGRRYVSPPLELPPEGDGRAADSGAELDVWETLTGRELHLLRLAISSLPEEELARRLAVSPDAVQRQLADFMRKLGVQTRGELAQLARSRGMSFAEEATR